MNCKDVKYAKKLYGRTDVFIRKIATPSCKCLNYFAELLGKNTAVYPNQSQIYHLRHCSQFHDTISVGYPYIETTLVNGAFSLHQLIQYL
jgi:hypothetical protein